jgi:hypothetical protein
MVIPDKESMQTYARPKENWRNGVPADSQSIGTGKRKKKEGKKEEEKNERKKGEKKKQNKNKEKKGGGQMGERVLDTREWCSRWSKSSQGSMRWHDKVCGQGAGG